MYWFKKYFLLIAASVMLLSLAACKQDKPGNKNELAFFDLKGYFQADSARLTKLNPLITKTVWHNKDKQTKQVHIPNWGNELRLFAESDINKPAWKASYKIVNSDGILSYTAKDPALKTQDIIIKKKGDKVMWILIINHTKSTVLGKVLYETTEKLSYIPDSTYQIQKRQFVRTLGFNTYSIKGRFN
jgi:hypothetical protein